MREASAPPMPARAADRQDAVAREPRGYCGDVLVGQLHGDRVHAIRRERVACARTPGAHLPRDIARVQTEQAGNARLLAGHARAMTRDARGNLARRIALRHEPLTGGEHRGRDVGVIGIRIGRLKIGEVLADLVQILVGQKCDQVTHRRIGTAAVAECDELIEQIVGGLAGDAREVIVIEALTLHAMTRGAGAHALVHGRRHCAGCIAGR